MHAGSPGARAADLHGHLLDPAVAGVLCVRGGAGTLGLLPEIDYRLVASHPKLILGMSDVTALQLAVYARSHLTGISGPMVVQLSRGMSGYTARSWLALVQGPFRPGQVPLPRGVLPEVVRGGNAEGPLLPCNLSLLTRLIGTPYLPSLAGTVLVLEDIQETPQSLDRMIWQLRLSGVTSGLAGLVLGQFTRCLPRERGVSEADGRAVVLDWARSLGVPVLAGFPYGHGRVQCSLPFGTRARLTSRPPGIHLLESPTA